MSESFKPAGPFDPLAGAPPDAPRVLESDAEDPSNKPASPALESPREARPPLPAPLVKIWENFVLDQAARGRTEVHYMVPILISMLSERGVANLRPDEKRRHRLERWRDSLKAEAEKIARVKLQGDTALQDGYRAIDIAASTPLIAVAGKNDTQDYAPVYAPVLMFTKPELEEHKRAVTAQVGQTAAALKELNLQQETMVHQRLQLMQRLSSYSSELLEIGHEVVRKYQASELQRITLDTNTEADVDAALASLLPPPAVITYGIVFNTLWQKIERAFAGIMALEPRAVKAWRQRVTAQLLAALRR